MKLIKSATATLAFAAFVLAGCEEKGKQTQAAEGTESSAITVEKASGNIAGNYHFFADEQTDERIIFYAKDNLNLIRRIAEAGRK